MAKLGYSDYFVEKPSGISGSAIFFKRSRFECLQQHSVAFGEDASQFFMYTKLKDIPSGQTLIFGETHLKAKPKFVEERIK